MIAHVFRRPESQISGYALRIAFQHHGVQFV
jgi:hypothetical protein